MKIIIHSIKITRLLFEFNASSDRQFYFIQYDIILNVYIGVNDYYISEEGSGIMLHYFPFSNETKFESNIYINNESQKKIKNCEALMNLADYDYIFCNISQEEIEFFDKENKNIYSCSFIFLLLEK